ncbi:MAG: Nudix family hydrolase [Proteobacteria bacterium]|nr:Nudix family hydrolase [Pseudomonadota bacterium]NOG60102.1 Nudix family hydrolase [Pseudomonadota bacterium]
MNTRTHVAVGVIFHPDKNKVLITRRSANQHLAGLWEFPGGKVEKNESVVSALHRELHEELGITVKSTKKLTRVSYDYPDKKVLLDVFKVYEWDGNPISRENQKIVWSNLKQLNNYAFPEANKHIIQTLSLGSIYVISPPSCNDTNRFISVLDECFSTGVKIFQLRLYQKYEPEFSQIVSKIIRLAEKYDAKIILNGLASDVSEYNVNGIHLNSRELFKHRTRPISEEYILGASCHNEKELIHAEQINVNYAFISPVCKTASHPEKVAIGWDNFCEMSKKVNFPVYALGGMKPSELELARKYNAYGVAMIGAIWD